MNQHDEMLMAIAEQNRKMTAASEGNKKLDIPVTQEYTGGSVSYYQVVVRNPTTRCYLPYTAECNDIIEALGMNYAEGNAFKAIWRMCAARLGKSKRGYKDSLYDSEKVVFFGERMVEQAKMRTKEVVGSN